MVFIHVKNTTFKNFDESKKDTPCTSDSIIRIIKSKDNGFPNEYTRYIFA